MKAVLTHKPRSIYDDLPWERYHFPRTYLRQVERAIGDFVIYYEPRREGPGDAAYRGRQAYFATARVKSVRQDTIRPDHFFADIDEFFDFLTPVPFRDGYHYYESGLRKDDGSTNLGLFRRAVRNITNGDYEAIVRAGFARELTQGPIESRGGGLQEPASSPFWLDSAGLPLGRMSADRIVSSRQFRDRAFASAVQDAYNRTCAFTGLRLINGGGRAETEAAHIRPVEDNGPDTIRNGLALSSTVHWMFDRGFISVAPDGSMLIKPNTVPPQLQSLFFSDRKIRLPKEPWLRPAAVFLEYHRNRHKFVA